MAENTAEHSIGDWLAALASGEPVPGGGGAAALLAATGAALIGMVANLTIGKPAYAEHEQTMREALLAAGTLRGHALAAADEDAHAFAAVIAAYRLPKDTGEARATRSRRIQDATLAAANTPVQVAQIAAEIVDLAGRIEPGANLTVLSDVAVAAQCARAALDAAAINVEINLAGLDDNTRRAQLRNQLDDHRSRIPIADLLIAEVRKRIAA